MVRAYGEAAKRVIQNSVLEPFVKKEPFTLKTPYSTAKRYEHFLKKENIEFSNREFGATEVIWHLYLSGDQKDRLITFKNSL